jgi:hypothetical protein
MTYVTSEIIITKTQKALSIQSRESILKTRSTSDGIAEISVSKTSKMARIPQALHKVGNTTQNSGVLQD